MSTVNFKSAKPKKVGSSAPAATKQDTPMDGGPKADDGAIVDALGPAQPAVTQTDDHVRSHFLRQKATIKNTGGSIVQFLTNNDDGHSQCIGIMRLPPMRVDELLDCVADCQGHIKSAGINAWKGHVNRTNNPVGFSETLPHEDFGMSMTLRVTSNGRLGPHDGEVFVGAIDFPGLIEPLDLTAIWERDGASQPCYGYWFNCRIILNEATKRRSLLKAASIVKEGSPNGKIGTHVMENAGQAERPAWPGQPGSFKRRAEGNYFPRGRKDPRPFDRSKKYRPERPQSRGDGRDRPYQRRDEPERRDPPRQHTPVPADFTPELPPKGRLPEWNKSSEPPSFDYGSWKVIDNDRRKKQSASVNQH